MKRGLLASYALIFAGFTLISLSAGSSIVTGNAVFNETSGSIASVAGLAFIGSAIGLFLGEGGLEYEEKSKEANHHNNEDRKHPLFKKHDGPVKYASSTWKKYKECVGNNNTN